MQRRIKNDNCTITRTVSHIIMELLVTDILIFFVLLYNSLLLEFFSIVKFKS